MREDRWGGEAAVARLLEGASLEEALDAGDPAAWTALDEGVRDVGWYGRELLPTRAWVVGHHPEHTAEARLALALCHPDGRVREAAVRRAGEYPALLPLVVIRAADWVEPVRERAWELLRERLDAGTAVRLASLVLRVGRRERGAFAVEVLTQVLRGAPTAALLQDTDRAVRRLAYRIAVEERSLSPAELARVAAQDADVVVQDLCAEAALAAVQPDGSADDVLTPLLRARSPRARSAGVTALRRAGRFERAEGFLADRSALVRACARYVVRQGGGDPVAWYRARCADPGGPGVPPGAAVGLAECGDRADAELLWPLVGHPVAAVRARAVAGLRILDAADVRRLWPLLDDPAPGVVREVTSAVLPSAALVPEEWLKERLGAQWPAAARVAAVRLLKARG
ncbi:hypothetical protein [Streptomyces sp. NPDC018693]|uniref:hypothetical protein n=1 Tax=unclassified Streptomyces TaxID=2593676 RepID=UPI003796AF38